MAAFSPSSNGGGSQLDGKTLVLQAAGLVQVIGQTVALKKRGASHVGLCPFHNEKSPSFYVHPDKGFFYCHGCKVGGNVIDFVMKRDRLEFKDALHALADQFRVDLPRGGTGRESAGLRQQLLDACAAAATFFEQALHSPAGAVAREYLTERGFDDDTVRRFRVGMAPTGWDGLQRSPLMKKFRPELLVQAGLIKAGERGPGYYDTFRNRLMFPIRDETGRVIAFGGRVLPGNDSKAKYLNSPETPLFTKSKVAYGLDLGRQKIVETKTAAVVEGYADVVMAHQFGAANVVSVLGTAFTESHVHLLRRFAERIVFLFDGDNAGEMAVQRALELFLTQPIEIGIATLPDGMDPDEYLLQHGTPAFDALLAGAEDALTFQWRRMAARYAADGDNLTARSKTIDDYLGQIAAARATGPVDAIRWGATVVRLSHLTKLSKDDLNRRFRMTPDQIAAAPAPPDAAFTSFRERNSGGKTAFAPKPSAGLPGEKRSFNDSGTASRFAAERRPGRQFAAEPKRPVPPPQSGRYTAERWVLAGLLHKPSAWEQVQQVLEPNDFTSSRCRELAAWYWDHQRNEGEPSVAEVLALLDDGPLKALVMELASEDEKANNPQAFADSVRFIRHAKQSVADNERFGRLSRTEGQRLDESAEVDLLRLAQKSAGGRSGERK